jgi:hypothetical protein
MNDPRAWMNAPPYANDDSTFRPRYRARCFCGSVAFEVSAEPVDAKIGHCRVCQRLHGAPCQWAVIFHKHHVRFVKGVDRLHFFHSESGRAEHVLPCKLSCEACRAPIADEGRRMFLAFGPLFEFGSEGGARRVPEAFRARCHVFYGSRVMDVEDGLPKFEGHEPGNRHWPSS